MEAEDVEDDSCGSTDPRGSSVAGGQCTKGRPRESRVGDVMRTPAS